MLRQYEQLQALHMWLAKRVERGLSIPETLEETTDLVRSDPTGFPAHKFRYMKPVGMLESPYMAVHTDSCSLSVSLSHSQKQRRYN